MSPPLDISSAGPKHTGPCQPHLTPHTSANHILVFAFFMGPCSASTTAHLVAWRTRCRATRWTPPVPPLLWLHFSVASVPPVLAAANMELQSLFPQIRGTSSWLCMVYKWAESLIDQKLRNGRLSPAPPGSKFCCHWFFSAFKMYVLYPAFIGARFQRDGQITGFSIFATSNKILCGFETVFATKEVCLYTTSFLGVV